MTSKKGKYLSFIFSLIPGAGEMYMGFMKQGVSLMSMFFASILLASWLRADVLAFIGIIVWFYSFFHVHNLRSLPDEKFQEVEDKILVPFNGENLNINITDRKIRIAAAVFLIFYVISTLWNYLLNIVSRFLPEEFYYIVWDILYDIPEVVVALLIIWLGIRLIKGKKKELDLEEQQSIGQKD